MVEEGLESTQSAYFAEDIGMLNGDTKHASKPQNPALHFHTRKDRFPLDSVSSLVP